MPLTAADRPRRILVVKWGALGDLIAATTALRALREAWPSSRITILSNPLMQQICPPGTLVDEIIPLASPGGSALLFVSEQLRLIRRLRKEHFDLTINLRWTSERSAAITWLSGAPNRSGSGPASMAFLYTHRAPLSAGRRHEFQRHLDILAPLGISASRILPFVFCSPDDAAFAARVFRNDGLQKKTTVGMHPGASKPSKAWPAGRYAELARRLVGVPGVQVLVTWGPGEEELAKATVAHAGGKAVLAPPTPAIGGLASLIRSCGVYVCNYSGPMNVAMAVETPLVALGSTSPADWGPFGDIHRTVNKSGERDSYTEEEQLAMMEQIGVEEVETMVVRRLKELYAGETN
jgi:ADP-heptose:LPS heptosyltransferase